MMRLSLKIVGLAVVALQASIAAADCKREDLLAAANAYIAAQTAGGVGGDFSKLLAADNFTYMENNKKADIKTGVVSKALKLDSKRTTADTVNCASYTELISTGGPYVLGTQLRHSADGKVIDTVDVIAATTGALFFNAAKTLASVSKEDWGPIAADKRDSRKAIQDAADAYLDMWSNKTAMSLVPWGTPCQRVEGSMVVQPSCKAGAPTNGGTSPITMRRYVIDETVGSCDVMCAFGGKSTPDSHEFRLVGSKLVLVHTITLSI